MSYANLGLGYKLTDSLYINLTVANLFDTNPPMTADWIGPYNTYPGYYDVYGRSYTLKFSMQFFH